MSPIFSQDPSVWHCFECLFLIFRYNGKNHEEAIKLHFSEPFKHAVAVVPLTSSITGLLHRTSTRLLPPGIFPGLTWHHLPENQIPKSPCLCPCAKLTNCPLTPPASPLPSLHAKEAGELFLYLTTSHWKYSIPRDQSKIVHC